MTETPAQYLARRLWEKDQKPHARAPAEVARQEEAEFRKLFAIVQRPVKAYNDVVLEPFYKIELRQLPGKPGSLILSSKVGAIIIEHTGEHVLYGRPADERNPIELAAQHSRKPVHAFDEGTVEEILRGLVERLTPS